jgi:hypothetical protein
MTRFLFIFRSDRDANGRMTPEEMQKNHQNWDRWLKEGLKKGWLVDVGDGLKPEGRIVNREKVVTDGPFVESKEIVGGFTIIQAETIEAAAEIAKGCPMFLKGGTGGRVEVRPLWGFTLQS